MTTRTWPGQKASVALLLLSLAIPTTPAGATPVQVTPMPPAPSAAADAASTTALRTDADAIRLTLAEALAIALENNLGLAVERYNRAVAEQGVLANLGLFDLNFQADVDYLDSEAPSVREGAASKSQDLSFSTGLQQLLPWGTNLQFSLGGGKTESDSEFAFLDPEYSASSGLRATQPLLRNRGRLATEINLRIARLNRDASIPAFEAQVSQLLRDVENAYWLLAEAQAQVQVAEQSLALAKELDQMNRVRVDVGTLAPLELVSSEAGIAGREGDIIVAQTAVGDAQDLLRRLLDVPSGELWSRDIVTETEAEVTPPAIDVEAAIRAALAERPEIAQQRLTVATREVEYGFRKNQALPRLDARGGITMAGAGGSGVIQDVPPIVIDSNLGDAFEQVTGGDFPTYFVGVTLALPIQNRTARANRTVAELALAQAQVSLRDLESTITTEVRTAARGVDSAAKLVEAARASQRLQEKNLDAERKRYENGMSTSFQVLEVQEDVTTARSNLVRAMAFYRRAIVSYYAAIGGLLDHNGVEIAETVNAD
jgi:outer membrane protein